MIESTIDTRQPRFWGTSSEQAPYRLRTPRLEDRFPSLEEILASQDELPALSLILGLGEDGVPLVVDLEDPEGSAFLIASDDGFDNTALLHNLITAALKGNHPEELFVHLISPHADDLTYFHHQPHFRLSYQPFHPGTPIVIEEMVKLGLPGFANLFDNSFAQFPGLLFEGANGTLAGLVVELVVGHA
ncbi:MAG: hypothetical protein ACK2T7_09575, partial [Anaerolineales bacterium]